MYPSQVEKVVDIKKFFQWVEKTGLRASAETLILEHKSRPSTDHTELEKDRTAET